MLFPIFARISAESLTEKTAKFHLTQVFEKLGAESRIEAVLWLIERDLAAMQQQQQRNTP
jgi:hypothetical protein